MYLIYNKGHVDRFTDLLVSDVKLGTGFRADKLLVEFIENKLNKEAAKLNEG